MSQLNTNDCIQQGSGQSPIQIFKKELLMKDWTEIDESMAKYKFNDKLDQFHMF